MEGSWIGGGSSGSAWACPGSGGAEPQAAGLRGAGEVGEGEQAGQFAARAQDQGVARGVQRGRAGRAPLLATTG